MSDLQDGGIKLASVESYFSLKLLPLAPEIFLDDLICKKFWRYISNTKLHLWVNSNSGFLCSRTGQACAEQIKGYSCDSCCVIICMCSSPH
jgi:hypothetical protein